MQQIAQLGSELLRVAQASIVAWLSGEPFVADSRREVPAAPVFVTLRRADGSLRGCVGSITAVTSDVLSEVARSARLAASRDPRFAPLQNHELSSLSIEVSVLLEPEPVLDIAALDPIRYGVTVRASQGRRALLLPLVPGIDDVETQLSVARSKAGVGPGEPIELERFEVLKFVAQQTVGPRIVDVPVKAGETA